MKRTRWFPSSIKPARFGLYECRWDERGLVFQNWWSGMSWTTRDGYPTPFGLGKGHEWRGLTEPA